MGVVKAVAGKGKRQRGGRGRGRGKGKGKAMKKMIMKTLVDAHCDHASNGDATKDAACEKCFAEAVPSKSLTGKGAVSSGYPNPTRYPVFHLLPDPTRFSFEN